MTANPFLGVLLHWIGGLAAASFYIPYRAVKRWSWESYWLVGGIFSWIVMPWLAAALLVPDLGEVLGSVPKDTLFWACLFGALWGIGGLTFGLTMRYLGIALGMAVALGFTAIFGTLIPPIFHGELGGIAASQPGRFILLGVLVSVLGIAVSGMAGMSKERELTTEQKLASVKEFDFRKGMLIATFSGIMSSCMAFGLDAGSRITEAARTHLIAHGSADIWQGLPVLIVVLMGGFTTNFLWCVFLNIRNGSGSEYFGGAARDAGNGGTERETAPASGGSAAGAVATLAAHSARVSAVPLAANYLFSAMAGIIWYLQFFFYTMGQTKMGAYGFSSWTLHMASIMIFSTLWGIALKEWAGSGSRTRRLVMLGLAALIASTVIIGYGNLLKAGAK